MTADSYCRRRETPDTPLLPAQAGIQTAHATVAASASGFLLAQE
jgi:hypothetical protein